MDEGQTQEQTARVRGYSTILLTCTCGWEHGCAISAGETPFTCPTCHACWVVTMLAPAITVETFRYRCAHCGAVNSAPYREGATVACVGCRAISTTTYDDALGSFVAATIAPPRYAPILTLDAADAPSEEVGA